MPPEEPKKWWPEIGQEVWYNRPDNDEPLGKVVSFVPDDETGRMAHRVGQPVIEAYPGRTSGDTIFEDNKKPKLVVVHPMFLLPFPYGGEEWQEHDRAGLIR